MMSSAAKVEANQRYRDRLGWTVAELFPEGIVDGQLIDAIGELQRQFGITDDGVCGPETYGQVLERNRSTYLLTAKHLALGANTPRQADEALRYAGLVAVAEAKLCFLEDITDLPPRTSPQFERCAKFIDNLIRTTFGINWTWESPYRRADQFKWCGTLPACGWGNAGLKVNLRTDFFASNFRLDRYARYERVKDGPFPPKPATGGPHRMIIGLDEHTRPEDVKFPDGSSPRAGDIMLIGDKNPAWGDHITMLERWDAGEFWQPTIEGNGRGFGPDGLSRDGIVRAKRRIGNLPKDGPTTSYFALRIIRVGFDDIVFG